MTDQPQPPAPYCIEDGRICRRKSTRDGIVVVESLCNFEARIAEEIALDDGVEVSRAFKVEGRLDSGESLPPVRIPAVKFGAMSWVSEVWGARAIVRAGLHTRDCLREAIQRLSSGAPRRHVFSHTGWREIDGRAAYLTAAGAVGLDGVEVDLGHDLGKLYRLPRDSKDPVVAMRASLELLKMAPYTVTVPLWAATYRAPLAHFWPVDMSLWLEGPTGSFKSTLAALFLAHYGTGDTRA